MVRAANWKVSKILVTIVVSSMQMPITRCQVKLVTSLLVISFALTC